MARHAAATAAAYAKELLRFIELSEDDGDNKRSHGLSPQDNGLSAGRAMITRGSFLIMTVISNMSQADNLGYANGT